MSTLAKLSIILTMLILTGCQIVGVEQDVISVKIEQDGQDEEEFYRGMYVGCVFATVSQMKANVIPPLKPLQIEQNCMIMASFGVDSGAMDMDTDKWPGVDKIREFIRDSKGEVSF